MLSQGKGNVNHGLLKFSWLPGSVREGQWWICTRQRCSGSFASERAQHVLNWQPSLGKQSFDDDKVCLHVSTETEKEMKRRGEHLSSGTQGRVLKSSPGSQGPEWVSKYREEPLGWSVNELQSRLTKGNSANLTTGRPLLVSLYWRGGDRCAVSESWQMKGRWVSGSSSWNSWWQEGRR